MSLNLEYFWEVVSCQNTEQTDWLVNRFKELSVAPEIESDGCNVTIGSGDGLGADFGGLAHAVAAYQKQFNIKTPWVGSYCAVDVNVSGRQDSYSGAVVIHCGKEHWFNATDLAKVKAKKLKSTKRK